MRRIILFNLFILLFFSMVFTAKYVGAKKCKMCHNSGKHGKAYEKLYRTKHSLTFQDLVKEEKDKDPYCVVCHTTGFNKGGYRIGAPDAKKFEGVQCEVCHGPGSEYMKSDIMKDRKKAIASGLIIPTKETWLHCHDKNKYPWAKDFNYEERLKKIDHRYLNRKQ